MSIVHSMSSAAYHDHVAYAVASKREWRVALGAVAFAVVLALAAVVSNFWNVTALGLASLLPISMTVMATTLAITTAILRNQYRASGLPSFAFLGTAYGVAATYVTANTLSLSGVFPLHVPAVRESQIPVWIWVSWHAGFVLLTAGYVWAQCVVRGPSFDAARRTTFVRAYVATSLAVALAILCSIFMLGDRLPILIDHGRYTFAFHALVEEVMAAGDVLVLLTLIERTRLRETTHLWLAAVLVTMLLETVTIGEIARAPFTIAWFLARAIGWFGVTLYLSAQLRHLQELLTSFAEKTIDLEQETQRDALTELYNRRGFDARFANALKECELQQEAVALLLLDLDHFKLFNDYFGHVAGDEALRTLARTLASVANRPRDSVCRIGGEEFAIVLPATDAAGAMTVAERVREAVMRVKIPHSPGAPLPIVTVSIGIAALDARTVPVATALRTYGEADTALYRAKAGGRNRICRSNGQNLSIIPLRAM